MTSGQEEEEKGDRSRGVSNMPTPAPGSTLEKSSSSRRHTSRADGSLEEKSKDGLWTDQGLDPLAAGSFDEDVVMAPGPISDGHDRSGSFGEAARGVVDLDGAAPINFARPPFPPPLTPPTLAALPFPFENRLPGYAASIPPQLDVGFIHQPNPDYMASSTSADLETSPQNPDVTPRRRSYAKTVPIGIPTPAGSSLSQQMNNASAGPDTFSPSSYPPTSPRLPPPPPNQMDDFLAALEFAGGRPELEVQGEIISVVDDAGYGWKRHTRVYGGGVCLACLAAKAKENNYPAAAQQPAA
ncbi:hypothetical protein VTK73DRAFT_2866 [Phialemonium thermophilum]|uniref:SH3 domain-containing protein n=1 Tax=Phialemonium thermophilum TaxID=223376 RepID=A0ABR3VNG8_9PEZI